MIEIETITIQQECRSYLKALFLNPVLHFIDSLVYDSYAEYHILTDTSGFVDCWLSRYSGNRINRGYRMPGPKETALNGGEAGFRSKDYDRAIEGYTRYLEYEPDEEWVKKQIVWCQQLQEWQKFGSFMKNKFRLNMESKEGDGPSLLLGKSKDGKPLKNDGYNKVYNQDDKLWMDGEFKGGRLFDGKLYKYDSNGILIKIEIWKWGEYHSDQPLQF